MPSYFLEVVILNTADTQAFVGNYLFENGRLSSYNRRVLTLDNLRIFPKELLRAWAPEWTSVVRLMLFYVNIHILYVNMYRELCNS